MHNHYIINEAIEFHPAKSTLRNINNPDSLVTLNSPAGRCLLLLINRVGNIVTQQEFMDVVWKQSGMQVTSNAYYQNISVLRKGLKRIGLGEDIIVTIPRIGLTLASGTRIRKVEPEVMHEATLFAEQDVNHENSSDVPDASAYEYSEICDHEVIAKDTVTVVVTDDVPKPLPSSMPSSKILAVSALIITGAAVLAYFVIANQKPHYFSDYIHVKKIKDCEIFLSQALPNKSDRERALIYGERFTNDCVNYPWIYITKVPNLSRTSVIRCEKQFDRSSSCISEYFME